MSWTGSEHQRREQGGCSAPTVAFDRRHRWFVPAGAWAEVRSVSDHQWRRFQTTHDNEFQNIEEQARGCYVFRHLGYQIRISKRHVIDRTKT